MSKKNKISVMHEFIACFYWSSASTVTPTLQGLSKSKVDSGPTTPGLFHKVMGWILMDLPTIT